MHICVYVVSMSICIYFIFIMYIYIAFASEFTIIWRVVVIKNINYRQRQI